MPRPKTVAASLVVAAARGVAGEGPSSAPFLQRSSPDGGRAVACRTQRDCKLSAWCDDDLDEWCQMQGNCPPPHCTSDAPGPTDKPTTEAPTEKPTEKPTEQPPIEACHTQRDCKLSARCDDDSDEWCQMQGNCPSPRCTSDAPGPMQKLTEKPAEKHTEKHAEQPSMEGCAGDAEVDASLMTLGHTAERTQHLRLGGLL